MNNLVEYPELVELARLGDLDATKELAEKYYSADPKSRLAFEWFYRAAKQDDAEAQYRIGSMFFHGIGNERNYEKAAEWLLKAYHQDYWAAMVELGLLMEDGFVFSPTSFPYKTPEKCYSVALRKYQVIAAQSQLQRLQAQQSKAKNSHGLDDLVGLAGVKTELKKIENVIRFESRRASFGLPSAQQSHHFMFMGNPGTGKTEVARSIGGLLKEIGVLKSGHMIEVDRAGLIGQYKGETAEKVTGIIEQALDGVLFIDEAHTLVQDSLFGDYGQEALNLVLKAMEDHRDRLVVIMAGYEEPLKCLVRSNMGLKSRIKHALLFADYTATELAEIYKKHIVQQRYTLTSDAEKRLTVLMDKAIKSLDSDLGNARFARNAVDRTIEKLAMRVINTDLKDKGSLTTIEFTDVPTWNEMMGNGSINGDADNILPFVGH